MIGNDLGKSKIIRYLSNSVEFSLKSTWWPRCWFGRAIRCKVSKFVTQTLINLAFLLVTQSWQNSHKSNYIPPPTLHRLVTLTFEDYQSATCWRCIRLPLAMQLWINIPCIWPCELQFSIPSANCNHYGSVIRNGERYCRIEYPESRYSGSWKTKRLA